MSVTLSDVENTGYAVRRVESAVTQREERREEFHEHERTRQQLEQPQETGDLRPSEWSDEDEELGCYRMTEKRRVGTLVLDTEDDGPVSFGKPAGLCSSEILEPLNKMDRTGAPVTELQEYVFGTLEAWSLDEDRDYYYWGENHGLVDATKLVRNLSLAGNAPTR